MLETSARILRLLALLQQRREWSGSELAERLDVTPRTIRNDVERLRDLGYPVDSSPGVGGGYQLGVGAELPPLLLDDDEAIAVALGLRLATTGAVVGIEEASVRALIKLERMLPTKLSGRVKTLQTYTVPVASHSTPTNATTLVTIAGAARDSECIRFDYIRFDKTTSSRLVEPYRLINTRGRWYLFAWDCDQSDWRTFRVDRMDLKANIGPRFIPKELPDKDIGELVSKQLASAMWNERGRLRFLVDAATARQRIPSNAGELIEDSESSCILEAGSDNLEMLALYAGMSGFEFEVLQPPELKEQVRIVAERFTRAANRGELRG